MRARILCLSWTLALGCDEQASARPAPPVVETLLDDPRGRVTMTAVDLGGLQDPVFEYRIELHTRDHRRVAIQSGTAEHVSGRAHAVRLASGAIAVAFDDRLCVAADGVQCNELTDDGAAPLEALWWRANDRDARPENRVRAAIALAWIDREMGLSTIRSLDGAAAGFDALEAELDATRARLDGDSRSLVMLRDRIATGSAVVVAGIARACVPRLRRAIALRRAEMEASCTALVDAALASCARHRP